MENDKFIVAFAKGSSPRFNIDDCIFLSHVNRQHDNPFSWTSDIDCAKVMRESIAKHFHSKAADVYDEFGDRKKIHLVNLTELRGRRAGKKFGF